MKRSIALILTALFFCAPVATQAQTAPFSVNGSIALASFQSLVDNHLETMADSLETLAMSDAAMSLNWNRIKPALLRVGSINVPAVLWYVRTDGSYYTTMRGLEPNNLSDRAYFKPVMAGHVSIGQMVYSRATQREVAVVVVPIFSAKNRVIGALGASVYLDELSRMIRDEMGLAPDDIFYTMDSTGTIGLNWDRTMIFMKTRTAVPALAPMVDRMLGSTRGVETYTYRGKVRSIVYKKSPLTGWWYAIGTVH